MPAPFPTYCKECRWHREGRCIRFPPFVARRDGAHRVPRHYPMWSQEDQPLVDPDELCCGEGEKTP